MFVRKEQLNYPLGVTVDNKTGNIYIADHINNCVKVFDRTGKYLFKFGNNEDEGNMLYPCGVAIYGDRILISHSNHCIISYQLNGKFISRMGTQGKGESVFDFPFGLTINDSNGDINICDRKITAFRYLLKISLSNLGLEKIHSSVLLMLNSPRNSFSFLMHLILVSISSTIITFYRRVLFLEEKECK